MNSKMHSPQRHRETKKDFLASVSSDGFTLDDFSVRFAFSACSRASAVKGFRA